jgi:hypothetical protein
MEEVVSSAPTSQNNEVEKLMEDALIKELNEKEQQELKDFLENKSLGINVAMQGALDEIMNGGAK